MTTCETSRLVSMSVQATAKRSKVAEIEERVKSGKCLVCETEATRRGVCFRHYQMFLRWLASKPKEQRAETEVRCIQEGRILAVNQVREIKAVNPFADL